MIAQSPERDAIHSYGTSNGELSSSTSRGATEMYGKMHGDREMEEAICERAFKREKEIGKEISKSEGKMDRRDAVVSMEKESVRRMHELGIEMPSISLEAALHR